MTKPKVTAIIPVFNAESWLAECLESILRQDCQDMEILCINDGSIDNSVQILEQYAEKDSRIKIISQKNHGLGYTRNAGIEKAEGKYILCIDSDDLISDGSIAPLITIAEQNSLDLLCFDFKPFVENKFLKKQFPQRLKHHHFDYPGVWDGRDLFTEMQKKNDYFCSGCMALYRTEWLRKNKIRCPEQILHEDEYFLFCCFLYAKKASFIPSQAYIYRLREGSITSGEKAIEHIKGYYRTAKLMMEKCFLEQEQLKDHPEFFNYALHIQHSASYLLRQNRDRINKHSLNRYEQMMLEDLYNYGSLAELEAVYNSASWKIGQKLINPLHKIKESVYRLKRDQNR